MCYEFDRLFQRARVAEQLRRKREQAEELKKQAKPAAPAKPAEPEQRPKVREPVTT